MNRSGNSIKITIVGIGYVGLGTAVAFASKGYQVTCIDVDSDKIARLNHMECPIHEPELPELLIQYFDNLYFTTDAEKAYLDAEAIVLAVGTPETENGSANLSYIYQVLDCITQYVAHKCTIIIKSTVPVGTHADIKDYLLQNGHREAEYHVVSNPEFLSQGTAVRDMLKASRVVIGVDTEEDRAFMEQLYEPFDLPLLFVGCASAEMIKYASNDFLALKISYINEIANLCEKTGADILEVAEGMGKDPRIGNSFLKAGIGYGGSCFPKDTKALHWLASSNGYEIQTIKAAIEVNEKQKLKLLEKAKKYYADFRGITVAFLGVTFKPNTDDLREAPSLINAKLLLEQGAKIKIWDPCGADKFAKKIGMEIEVCRTIQETLKNAELCMIFTEWDEIRKTELSIFEKYMKKPIVLDGRNCLCVSKIEKSSIVYEAIGRKVL